METTKKTNRQLVCDIIAAVHPEVDVSDDETIFGIIYDDYEQYADVVARREEAIRQAENEAYIKGRNSAIEEGLVTKEVGDGIPALGGAHIAHEAAHTSIFDIANY